MQNSSWSLTVKLLSDECHRTSLMINQHRFRLWFGAIRHQTITWANVDPDLCCHMASLSHNELIKNTLNITQFGATTRKYWILFGCNSCRISCHTISVAVSVNKWELLTLKSTLESYFWKHGSGEIKRTGLLTIFLIHNSNLIKKFNWHMLRHWNS